MVDGTSTDKSWVDCAQPYLTFIKDIATIVAAVVAIIAAFVAANSLLVAASQLELATNSIRSNTVYQLSKEGRDLAARPDRRVGDVLSFVHAAWHQRRLDTLDERVWKPIVEELCAYQRATDFNAYWKPDNQRFFDPEFVAFVEEKRKQCASP